MRFVFYYIAKIVIIIYPYKRFSSFCIKRPD